MIGARGQKILLVDDDEEIVRLTKLLLESRGYACQTAHSGAQGLNRFVAEDFRLILTDLQMAIGDGITFVNAVRERSSVPIIVLTGFSGPYAQQLTQLSNVSMVSKPFEMTDLLKRVHKACGGRGADARGVAARPGAGA